MTTSVALPRPRWFPETDHEDSVYDRWRAAVALDPASGRFRDWYEATFPDRAIAGAHGE